VKNLHDVTSKLGLNEEKKEICQLNSHILLNKPDLKTVKNKTAALLNDSMRFLQGGSNMTRTDLCVNKPHCAAAVRPHTVVGVCGKFQRTGRFLQRGI